ncbi:hypothetical protein COW36_21985 [bacterium (Candidatus Blackallbacteria) CG17_big_fil_post_rev_8_21_14_2_50_48_46]|uniref:Uncharacterized protein n=1 Tax=bacterium (Candidatus Blackallbacteria) CG17_big_fil_post_rev_8_21_14_2_50_48_46 TaxID=2014261 RepID=A0A2M7FYM4_9BACT|nr:MAG: hypothetical protein COW64_13415 [bacterium (Candidatus Blackallbacteria) CG18_big_fil_WC_8_21_14_2_50_49_26]PIW14289.1 MAG: hypothetical protein COW36_21985 [bacterium (Candidatus Blackallbacteria) CG17_big_fil_post_rev_8_21_14_2_50_48_46]PIW45558.1 MAG: hypothetical protein COW20_19590 [bacterium (Candidatus Blackallbacteria) CG13_big_fil_rev_8_21_14_2_50_49_14]
MTYTSGYQSQVPGTSVYSPFNRNGAGTPAPAGNYPGYSPTGPASAPAMGSDAFVPVSSPEDMDRVVSSIDDKIARIRQAFSQPSPAPGMPTGAPQAPAVPQVSQDEIQWALQLEQKVKGGQQPTAQETARYEDIAKRLAAAQQAPAAPTAPQAPAAPQVSQDEIQWALQLEQKVKGGQQPTAQETARYEDIAKRLAAAQQAPAAAPSAPQAPAAPQVSQDEIQWALQLEQKVKGGQQPTAQETARYEDIAKRLAAAQQAPATAPTAPNGNRDWSNWSKPFAPPAASAMPLPIAAPGSGQPVVTVPTSLRGAPQTPPAVAMTQPVPASLTPAPMMPQAATAPQQPPTGNVSQQEIQWALQLEQRVNQQKYQPTAQETAAYQNIAQRLSAAQSQPQTAPVQPAPQFQPQTAPPAAQPFQPQTLPPASQPMMPQAATAPQQPAQAPSQMGNASQQEIQWALQLEQRVKQQGYQPSAQEVAAYENIAQRLSAAPPQQAAAPQMAPQGVPQQRPGMPPQGQQVMMPPTPQQVPIVPQQYPYVQQQTPQYIVQPQPFVPPQPQAQMAPPGYQQQQVAGMPQVPPPGQKPGFADRMKNAWNALWG